jgi:protein CpxP
MKKLLLIAIALITVNATAQGPKGNRVEKDQKERTQQVQDFSPEEIATLQTKRMALELGLNEAQQKQIQTIHLEQAKARKTEMEARKKMRDGSKEVKLSKGERFNRVNSQLDEKLATKTKMKSILTKEQFEKWERQNAMKGRRNMKDNKDGKRKMKQKRKQRL